MSVYNIRTTEMATMMLVGATMGLGFVTVMCGRNVVYCGASSFSCCVANTRRLLPSCTRRYPTWFPCDIFWMNSRHPAWYTTRSHNTVTRQTSHCASLGCSTESRDYHSLGLWDVRAWGQIPWPSSLGQTLNTTAKCEVVSRHTLHIFMRRCDIIGWRFQSPYPVVHVWQNPRICSAAAAMWLVDGLIAISFEWDLVHWSSPCDALRKMCQMSMKLVG